MAFVRRPYFTQDSAEPGSRSLLQPKSEDPEEKPGEETCFPDLFRTLLPPPALPPTLLLLQAPWDSAIGMWKTAVCRSPDTPTTFPYPLPDQPYHARSPLQIINYSLGQGRGENAFKGCAGII